MTDGARDDVTKYDNAEARDANAAQDHKQVFEGIEYAPFQVALFVQDQAVEAHRSIPELQPGSARREARSFPSGQRTIVRCERAQEPSRHAARDLKPVCPGSAC